MSLTTPLSELNDCPQLVDLAGSFVKLARKPASRTQREFAESEIVIAYGPHVGPYQADIQPYSLRWLELVDSRKWNIHVATGPSQSGKTLVCFVIPVLYHLFELNEGVICLVPSWDMAKDKWRDDILPAIEASRFRSLLPVAGPGSRGGAIGPQQSTVNFQNGAWLKFMTGGGDDQSRAGKTCRVLMVTEADGMDEAGEASRETDKITQAMKRTAAYGDDAVVYMECTVTIPTGRIWRELQAGTNTRIVVQCRACDAWTTPERESLVGYEDAANVIEARKAGRFSCPSCGVLWSEQDRIDANRSCRALHAGQEIDENGEVTGEEPATDTLSFRWNAFNNLLMPTAKIVAEEFKSAQDPNRENAEKGILQFIWTKPFTPDAIEVIPLDATIIAARLLPLGSGIVPMTVQRLTMGVDCGKRWLNWTLIAWTDLLGATCHIPIYGKIRVESDTLGEEKAMWRALELLDQMATAGWHAGNLSLSPSRICLDSGYMTHIIYNFVRTRPSGKYWPIKGYGTGDERNGRYVAPAANAKQLVGDNYHITKVNGVLLLHLNADHWKSFVHNRLTQSLGLPGAMTLFEPRGAESHTEFIKHLLAEQQVEKFTEGRGFVSVWKRIHRQNHWLDSTSYACVAGHLDGVRTMETPAPAVPVVYSQPLHAAPARPGFVRTPSWLHDTDEPSTRRIP